MSGSLNPIEDASDAFICLPSASDTAMLDDAFTAVGEVYTAAWRECARIWRTPVPLDEALEKAFEQIDDIAVLNEVVATEHRHCARGLGPSTDPVFLFYVRKAIDDHRRTISPFDSPDDPYQPWLHIGFPLPIENVSIETTEDGLDWLRFGAIGPVPFGFTGSVPTRVHTACFKRTDDLSGYEVVFIGEEIDPAGGALL